MLKMLSGPGQVLAKRLEQDGAHHLLVFDPTEPGWPQALGPRVEKLSCIYSDYALYSHDKESLGEGGNGSTKLYFLDQELPDSRSVEIVAIALPKGKEAMRMNFCRAAQFLVPGGKAWIVGPNKGGIRSAKTLVEELLGPVVDKFSARHSSLLESHVTELPPPYEDPRTFEVEAAGQRIIAHSIPGVFSHGRFDPGTEFLLANLPPFSFRRALDMGSGCGVIATILQRSAPAARVDCVDSSAMALTATRRTLEANGLDPSRVWASNLFSEVKDTYDLIITNPPFHRGFSTDFSITNQLIDDAKKHLTRNGCLIMVANRFINYFDHLRAAFPEVSVLAETTKFRVIEAKLRAG